MSKIDLTNAENYFEDLYRKELAETLNLEINVIPKLSGHRFSSSLKTLNFSSIRFQHDNKNLFIDRISPMIS